MLMRFCQDFWRKIVDNSSLDMGTNKASFHKKTERSLLDDEDAYSFLDAAPCLA